MKQLCFILVSALLVLLGCDSVQTNGGGDTPASNQAAPLGASKSGLQFDQRTLDEQFVDLADKIPGFAGFYRADDGMHVLRIKESAVEGLAPLFDGVTGGRRLAEVPANLRNSVRSAKPRTPGSALTFLQEAAEKDSVLVYPAEYDFAELQRVRDAVVEKNLLPDGVVFIDTDEVANRVVLGVERSIDDRSISKALEIAGLPAGALIFEPASKPVSYDNLWDKVRPTVGGLKIESGYCTMGFNLKFNSTTYAFMTADHCTSGTRGSMNGTTFYQPTIANQIGSETHNSASFPCALGNGTCYRSDVAIIQYNVGVTSIGSVAVTLPYNQQFAEIYTSFPLDHFETTLVAGYEYHKVGATTGSTIGSVDRTCVDTVVPEGGPWFVCQYTIRRRGAGYDVAAPGDSGAPVWRFVIWNGVKAGGILWGGPGPGAPDFGEWYWFAPSSNILIDTGLPTLTNSNLHYFY